MSFQLRIEHAGGETSTLSAVTADQFGDSDAPSVAELSVRRSLIYQPEETARAEVAVYRDAWTEIQSAPGIDPIDDAFYLVEGGTDIFGGRLRDHQQDGALVSVLLDGPKRDAIDAEPSDGSVVYDEDTDSAHLSTILGRVPTVSLGVDEGPFVQSIGFSESHAAPGKSLTKLAEATGARLRYNPDFTLDYLDRRGTDRSATISPDARTVISDPTVRRDETERVTHVRILGSQSGGAQVQAEAVASSYSDGRRKYRKIVDKDIVTKSRAQERASQAIAEYDGSTRSIEIEAEVPASLGVVPGDTFDVVLPRNGIDQRLPVVEAERLVDGSGDRYRVVLSNRQITRDRIGERNRRSLNEFRAGDAGQYYAISDGREFDPVDSTTDYSVSFYRPADTVGEYRAVLRVQSRPYRLRAEPESHAHSVSLSVGDHSHDVEIATPRHKHAIGADAVDAGTTPRSEAQTGDDDGGSGHSHSFAVNPTVETTTTLTETSEAGGGFTINETSDTAAPLNPGLIETSETASNVSVSVAGTTVASGLSAPVEESIDITGLLADGRNDITVTSDSLGEIAAVIEYEALKSVS